jgi:hypothetical protein
MKALKNHLLDPKVMQKVMGGPASDDEGDKDVPEADELEEEALDNRKIVIYVYVEKGYNSKKKSVTYEDRARGPVDCVVSDGFTGLLSALGEAAEVSSYRLEVKSISFKPEKPANAKLLPLSNQKGFEAMVASVFQGKKTDMVNIHVYMKPPKAAAATAVRRFTLAHCVFSHIIQPWNAVAGAPGPDEHSAPTSEEDMGPQQSRVSFNHTLSEHFFHVLQGAVDDKVMRFITEIDRVHPVGKCLEHPTIQCFFDPITRLHFNIDNVTGRPRKLSWAVSIVRSSFFAS